MEGVPPSHARPEGWTVPQVILAVAYVVLCPLIGAFAFVEIYQTVTHLVHPWFGDWAWIVPASAEGMFTALYAGWVLLELRDDPPRRVRVILAVFLTACGLASYTLNIWAAHGIIPDALAHAIVVTAFFGVLIFGKVLVRRLKVTASARALEAAMADARQYAIDLCRSLRGPAWRYRIPSLLRRQILAGRLADEVRSEVSLKVSMGRTSGWEETVRSWVLRELEIGAQAETDAQRVRQDIARRALPAPAETPSPEPAAITSGRPVQDALQKAPADAPQKPSGSAVQKARRKGGRKVTDEEIRDAIRELFADGRPVTKYRVVKELPLGEPRAERLLAEVQAERPSLTIARAEGAPLR